METLQEVGFPLALLAHNWEKEGKDAHIDLSETRDHPLPSFGNFSFFLH